MNILDHQTLEYCETIGLSAKAIGLIERYLECLCQANERCNLIGRKQDHHRICHYHVMDCLLPLSFLSTQFRTVYDIGSGAGLPGILWAIARPDVKFYLVEKSPKKCAFLTQTISALQLKNTQVINKRCESVIGTASLIVSRAMSSTKDFLAQTEQLSDGETQWWLMKALKSSVDEEIAQVDQHHWAVNIQPLVHPTQEVSRHLVCVSRVLTV